jgi:hypothetical protein
MRSSTAFTAYLSAAALSGALAGSVSHAADGQTNVTGLPTYPHDAGGQMDAIVRSIPNGQHCIHYSSNSPDPLATVEDWYKKSLPNAKIEDINKNSLYGNYFKLDGIKLLVGNDIVNVYRMGDSKQTSIEMFKCKDAVHSAS